MNSFSLCTGIFFVLGALFFAEGVDSHSKCCTIVTIIARSFGESNVHHVQSHAAPRKRLRMCWNHRVYPNVNRADITHMLPATLKRCCPHIKPICWYIREQDPPSGQWISVVLRCELWKVSPVSCNLESSICSMSDCKEKQVMRYFTHSLRRQYTPKLSQ